MEQYTYKINIKGIVQGVGFRPFVYKIAIFNKLYGNISNNSNGVEIILYSSKKKLELFIKKLKNNPPLLAKIDNISIKIIPLKKFDNFQIIQTKNKTQITTIMPPDVSICKDCEKELFDKNNRRHMYPFINCTNCGVRYSIIYTLPYDRKNTSMTDFEMCNQCKEEYNNPMNRRYHAQPIGCLDCGPTISLMDKNHKIINSNNIIDEAISFLKQGKILAIKGIGGYHLICDATNNEAIKKLRKEKKRKTKPFAIMVKDIKTAKELAYINNLEKKLLLSKERAIIILQKKSKNKDLIAPNISKIGIFLAYTPLHLLLLTKFNKPLIASSANVSNEPICMNLKELKKINFIYNYVIEHNREIINACDDSVAMVVKNQTILLRRARGYAPMSIRLNKKLNKKILSFGANQKSTICIGLNKEAITSPHIGDLGSISSLESYKKNINTFNRIYNFKADIIVCDKHPNYESVKLAHKIKQNNPSIKLIQLQHHYAHILAIMGEKQISKKVLGVAFDGTGYGDDGKLWGGEFLVCDYKNYKRVAHIQYFKLLGGEKAIKEPRCVALSFLFEIYKEESFKLNIASIKAFSNNELKTYWSLWNNSINSPLSSSMGRIFDVVASLLGICQVVNFEGESGLMLEEFYDKKITTHYSFSYEKKIINIIPMIKEIIKEENNKIAVSNFFNTIVQIIILTSSKYDMPLVLSGGVFQNKTLLTLVLEKLPKSLIGNKIPFNDGGISFGQVVYEGE
jgi:hydrogenase maturation protein HypF